MRIVFISLCCLSASVWADFNQALSDFHNNDITIAKPQFAALTDAGSVPAMHYLGLAYLQQATPEPIRAYGWLALAREHGHQASIEAIDKLWPHFGVRQRYLAEQQHQQLSQRLGPQALAQSLLPVWQPQRRQPPLLAAATHQQQVKQRQKLSQQVKFPRQARRQQQSGWVSLGFDIGVDGIADNVVIVAAYPPQTFEEQALALLAERRYQPSTEPLYGQQLRFSFRFDASALSDNELRELRRKAAYGDVQAAFQYVTAMLEQSTLPEQQLRLETMPLLLQAAQGGIVAAQLQLYQRLWLGDWVELDRDKARRWLDLAAASGDPWAQMIKAQHLSSTQPQLSLDYLKHAAADLPAAKILLVERLLDSASPALAEIETLLEQVPGSQRSDQWWLQLGRWHHQRGEPTKALSALARGQKLAEQRQRSPQAFTALAAQWQSD
ncbi:energy transducer TonB [Ferrimonas senticii]|uniref:energy transducer TonB n=1 Tax=Ferrimonas senticii TaxID=394566 RepID=UPI000411FFD8|nr:energy transducer TonB [Ferrimonas senticii]